MGSIFNSILNTLFPLHRESAQANAIDAAPILETLSLTYNPQVPVYTGLTYADSTVRTLLRANKFYANQHAARVLGAALGELLLMIQDEHALDVHWRAPLLVPIPLSQKRMRERGSNQVMRIIECVPKHILATYTILPYALKRHERKSQTHVSRGERTANVAGAFYIPEHVQKKELFKNKSVLLIDDVSETGATLTDAMRAVHAAGALQILGIALAK